MVKELKGRKGRLRMTCRLRVRRLLDQSQVSTIHMQYNTYFDTVNNNINVEYFPVEQSFAIFFVFMSVERSFAIFLFSCRKMATNSVQIFK